MSGLPFLSDPESRADSRPPPAALVDGQGRRLDYLRLSVTDRCNLRCRYCLPAGPSEENPRSEGDLLTWPEMLRLCSLFCRLGIRKIRLTGGEPLVRRGVIDFLARLRELPGRPELLLTTNGTLLAGHLARLAELGFTRLNVSLDSLEKDTYRAITGSENFGRAWRAVEAAADRGFSLKLNVVVLAGVNEDEIPDFVALTRRRDWTVRFIEPMPFRGRGGEPVDKVDGDRILSGIRRRFELVPESGPPGAVAELYRVPGFAGRVGLIRARSRTFCGVCSRLRVSAPGRLRTCLYGSPGLDLRRLLREGVADEAIAARIRVAVRRRFADGKAAARASRSGDFRSMSEIGG